MTQVSSRSWIYPTVALAIVALLIYMKPSRDREEIRIDAPAETVEKVPPPVETFQFVRSRLLPDPPASNQDRLTANPVDRWLERLRWAPPDLIANTQDLISTLDEADQRRFVEKAESYWRLDPIGSRVFLTTLAKFQIPEALTMLEEALVHSSAMLRSEAARAFSIVSSPEAALRMETLLYDSSPQVRRGVIQALIEMDDEPESLAVLQRYAETDPEEGIRHVLDRIQRDTESPDTIRILREYVDREDSLVSWKALESLILLGDPTAIDRAYAWLESPEEADQMRAAQFLGAAPADLLDVEKLAQMLAHRRGGVRRVATDLLARMAKHPDVVDKERITELLVQQSRDRELRVVQIALSGLYSLGHHDLAEEYIKRITTDTGLALHNSVDVAASLLRDARATPAILERLAMTPPPSSVDQGILINGLCALADPRALPRLLEYIRDAGPQEPHDADTNPLSYRVAHKIPAFGEPARVALLELLEEPDLHPFVYLRALDALRGFDPLPCTEEFLAIATDNSYPVVVRVAAIKSLPFTTDGGLYERLMEAIPELDDYEVGKAAKLVLTDYS